MDFDRSSIQILKNIIEQAFIVLSTSNHICSFETRKHKKLIQRSIGQPKTVKETLTVDVGLKEKPQVL